MTGLVIRTAKGHCPQKGTQFPSLESEVHPHPGLASATWAAVPSWEPSATFLMTMAAESQRRVLKEANPLIPPNQQQPQSLFPARAS